MQTKVNDECRKQVLELRGDNAVIARPRGR